MKDRGSRSSRNPTSFEKRFKIRPIWCERQETETRTIKHSIRLTAWIAIKEEDRRSEYRGKHSVMEDTRGVDADEVKQRSTKKVDKNEDNIHPGINANPLWLCE